MTLCSDGHDEVCFEGRSCPVCAEQSTIRDKDREIDNLKDELKTANDAATTAENRVAELEAQLAEKTA